MMMRRLLLAALLLLGGCTSTPFTSAGIERAVQAAAPVLTGMAQPAGGGEGGGATVTPTVIVVLPNVARGIWPLSAGHLIGDETIVIVVPRGGGGHERNHRAGCGGAVRDAQAVDREP